MAPKTRKSSKSSKPTNESESENPPNYATIIEQQLKALLPEIVTQVGDHVIKNGGKGKSHGDGSSGSGSGKVGCTFKEFTVCGPKEFDGKGGAIALTRWIEKMESVMDISECADHQKVKYAASFLINKALTWWNTQK